MARPITPHRKNQRLERNINRNRKLYHQMLRLQQNGFTSHYKNVDLGFDEETGVITMTPRGRQMQLDV